MAQRKLTMNSLARLVGKALRHCGWQVNKRFRQFATVRTRQGVFVVSLRDEVVGKHLYVSGEFELNIIRNALGFLRSKNLCPPRGKGTILDIGANIGVISIGALCTGEVERAIAIEPEPQNFSLLQRNVHLNHLQERILCVPCALYDQEGQISFEICDNNSGENRIRDDLRPPLVHELLGESGRRVITVATKRLDDLLLEISDAHGFYAGLAVVWIDVQGYEAYVFKGARNLLSTGIPVIAEIWPYGILRAGMPLEQFCQIAAEYWTTYWVWRRRLFVGYPIDHLDIYLEELGCTGSFGNVIFTA